MASPDDDRAPCTEENDGDGKRGLTVMKKVIRDRNKGIKLEVGWNEIGQPIEPNGSMLVSFIGVTVRRMVPITRDNWRKKDMDVIKDSVLKEILTAFVVDDMHHSFILKEAGKLHRSFRTHLAKNYLRDVDGNINDHPPKKYARMITEEEWRAFTAKRMSDSYKDLSNVNRERASNHLYPYKKSRMGYARLKHKMQQEMGSEHTNIPRRLLWKAARVNKAGVIDNENVQKVWDECEILAQSLSDEEVEDSGRKDILSQVLNVPEYPGRVRGVGFGVSQRDYFLPQKRAKQEDVERLSAMMDIVFKRLKKLEEKDTTERQTPDSSVPSANDSCTPASHNLPMGVFPCQLYLSSPHYRVVGQGKVFNKQGDNLHNQALPTGHIKVTIEVAVEPNAPLPVPIDNADFMVVGDAIGTFVAWPINLIDIGVECQKILAKSKQINKEIGHSKESVAATNKNRGTSVIQDPSLAVGGSSLSSYCSSLNKYVKQHMGPTDMKSIVMEEGIFGSSFMENIRRNEIYELLRHDLIGTSVINVYIRYLYDQVICPRGLRNRFSFISPHLISIFEDDQGRKIANILLKNKEKDKLILAPYNVGRHWVLVAVNATAKIIYYMDSLHGDYGNYPNLKEMFNTAIQIYCSQRGAKVSKSKSSNITWTKIECPRQTNNIDCGYYVMRFMKEIITLNQIRIPRTYFSEYKCINYSKAKLTDIKEEWSRYMVENIIDKEKQTM